MFLVDGEIDFCNAIIPAPLVELVHWLAATHIARLTIDIMHGVRDILPLLLDHGCHQHRIFLLVEGQYDEVNS